MIALPPFVDRYEFDERAAILEYDAGLPRAVAEQQALRELLRIHVERHLPKQAGLFEDYVPKAKRRKRAH